jgi:hypothetical protein
VIAAVISDRKNLGAVSGFAMGALLGIIGLIIVACQKPALPPAPAGMRAVKCTRCNAVQNVHQGQSQFECWQCKTVIPDSRSAPPQAHPTLSSPITVSAAASLAVGCIRVRIRTPADGAATTGSSIRRSARLPAIPAILAATTDNQADRHTDTAH